MTRNKLQTLFCPQDAFNLCRKRFGRVLGRELAFLFSPFLLGMRLSHSEAIRSRGLHLDLQLKKSNGKAVSVGENGFGRWIPWREVVGDNRSEDGERSVATMLHRLSAAGLPILVIVTAYEVIKENETIWKRGDSCELIGGLLRNAGRMKRPKGFQLKLKSGTDGREAEVAIPASVVKWPEPVPAAHLALVENKTRPKKRRITNFQETGSGLRINRGD